MSQDEQRVEVFRRDGAVWRYEVFLSTDRIRLASLEVEIDVARLYENPLG